MRLFGRRSGGERAAEPDTEFDPDLEAVPEADAEGSEQDLPARPGLSARPDGPWDVTERDESVGYVDLGALRLRGREGMELRLDVEESSGSVTAATIQLGGSAVQLQAFAAPRSEGLWPEIRSEIVSGIIGQGGSADEQAGVFGTEVLARIPVVSPDGRTGHQPARFAGIDGPRWFLRAVFHGPAVSEAQAALELESVVRDVVVVRGPEAMAPRDLLPLTLPREITGQSDEGDGEEQASERESLDPFRRGPEITEVR